jgi:hypothetical protein
MVCVLTSSTIDREFKPPPQDKCILEIREKFGAVLSIILLQAVYGDNYHTYVIVVCSNFVLCYTLWCL